MEADIAEPHYPTDLLLSLHDAPIVLIVWTLAGELIASKSDSTEIFLSFLLWLECAIMVFCCFWELQSNLPCTLMCLFFPVLHHHEMMFHFWSKPLKFGTKVKYLVCGTWNYWNGFQTCSLQYMHQCNDFEIFVHFLRNHPRIPVNFRMCMSSWTLMSPMRWGFVVWMNWQVLWSWAVCGLDSGPFVNHCIWIDNLISFFYLWAAHTGVASGVCESGLHAYQHAAVATLTCPDNWFYCWYSCL